MTTQGTTILNAALKLDESERRDIAERLFDSLDSGDSISDDAWFAELQRRSAEMAEDPNAGIAWEKLRNEW